MELTRREFLKLCSASAVGLGISQLYIPKVVEALAQAAGSPSVIWIQGASCTGCSISLLNTTHPTIAEVLLKIIRLQYHPTVMASAGEMAISYKDIISEKMRGNFFLVIEGSIPTKDRGVYCTIGKKYGKHITILEAARILGARAKAIIALGACAAFGGIPAGQPNPTGAKSVKDVIGLGTPIINIPGCPSHPDWLVGTLVHVLLYGFPELDREARPKIFFSDTIHQNCPYYSYFNEGRLTQRFGEKGCLIQLGCKGPMTNTDCSLRRWNSGVEWCVGVGAPCIGCCNPAFPDGVSPIYTALPQELWPEKETELALKI